MRIETTGKPKIGMTWDGYATITFTTARENLPRLEEIKANSVLCIEESKGKKSQSQNAYMWSILGEIARAVGISKEDAYREYIHEYGVYEVKKVRKEAKAKFITAWKAQGAGWICEEAEDDGESVTILCYKGTSTYTAEQMARIIDAIVEDAKSYGIDT